MIKNIKIKNFRNLRNDLVLNGLDENQKNLTIYGINNGSGKTNIFLSIRKSLGLDFFIDSDFPFNDKEAQQIKVEYEFDNISFNQRNYKNYKLIVESNRENPFFTKIRNNLNESPYKNPEKEKLLFAIADFFSLAIDDVFEQLFIEYFLLNNNYYLSSKRNFILLNQKQNPNEKLTLKFEKLYKQNLLAFSEILTALNKSISRNKNNNYQNIVFFKSNRKFNNETDKDEQRFISSLENLLNVFIEFEKKEIKNNVDLFALGELRKTINFIEHDYHAKTINLVETQRDWLEYFFLFFNKTKEEIFAVLENIKNNVATQEEIVLKNNIVNKLKELIFFYQKLVNSKKQNIKEVTIDSVIIKDKKIIVIKALSIDNKLFLLEQMGAAFLEFAKVLPLILFDSPNRIFMIDDFVDSYSKNSKDKILKFISKELKLKLIYSTSYLTDIERFKENSDLIIVDNDGASLDTLKETVLLTQIEKLKKALIVEKNSLNENNIEEQLYNEIENLRSELDNQKRLNDLENSKDRINEELNEKITLLEQIILEKDEIISNLQEDSSNFEKFDSDEIINLQKLVEQKDFEINSLKHQNEVLLNNQSTQNTTNLNEDLSGKIEELESIIDELIKENEAIENDLNEANSKLLKSSSELEKNNQIANENSILEENVRLKNELSNLKLQRERESARSKEESIRHETEFEELYSKVSLFENQTSLLEQEIQEISERNKFLEVENEKLMFKLENDEVSNLDMVQYKQNQIDLLENQIHQFNKKNLEFRELEKTNKEKISLLESQIIQLKLMGEKVESSKVIQKNLFENRERVLVSEIQELNADLANVKMNYENIKSELNQVNEENYRIKIDLDKVEFEKEQIKLQDEKIINDLSNKLEKSIIENKDKLTKIKSLEDEIVTFDKNLISTSMEVRKLNEKNLVEKEEFLQSKKSYENEINDLKSKIKQQLIEISNSNVLINSNKQEIEKLESQISSNQVKYEETQNKDSVVIANQELEIITLKENIKQLEEIDRIKNKESEFSSNEVKKLNENLQTLKQKLEEQKEATKANNKIQNDNKIELNKIISDLKLKLKTYENEISELELEVKLLKEEIQENNELTSEMQKIVDESEILENANSLEMNNLKIDNERLNHEISNMNKRFEKFEQEKANQLERITILKEETKIAKSNLKEELKEKDLINKKLNQLNLQLNSLENTNSKLQESIKHLEHEKFLNEKNLSKLDDLKNKLAEEKAKISKIESEKVEFEKRYNDLLKNNSKLKNELSQGDSLRQKNIELQNKIKEYQEEIKQQKSVIDSKLKEQKEFVREITIANQNQDSYKRQLSTIESNSKKLEKAFEKLNLQVNHLETANKDAKELNKKIEMENKKLIKSLEVEKTKKSPSKNVKVVNNTPSDYETTKAELNAKTKEINDLRNQIANQKVPTSNNSSKKELTELKNANDLLSLKIEELKIRLSKTESSLKEREDILRANNLLEVFSQSNYGKKRLILVNKDMGAELIKWITEREKILLSEFEYNFALIPSNAADLNNVMSALKQKEYDQIFVITDYANDSKKIYSSKAYEEFVKKVPISQLKPYYWNMKRNTKSIQSISIPEKEKVTIERIVENSLNSKKVDYNKNNSAEKIQLLISILSKNKDEYKKFLKEHDFDKLIKILKAN